MIEQAPSEMRDEGPRRSAGLERFCAATGAVRPVSGMIRFVVGPGGAAVPDLGRRLPGRGIWITATRRAMRTAIARNAFARGFRRDVCVAQDLIELTERLIERAALDALAMTRKAGRAAIGYTKVEAALLHHHVTALLHASDAAPDGVRKLDAALQRRRDAVAIAVIDAFSSAQLDLALGRPNVIHAALLAGPETDTFLARKARLVCFGGEPVSG